MIRSLINRVREWLTSRATKGGFLDEPNIPSSPEVLRRLEKAKEDFEAAVKLWPRNRTKIEETWIKLRDAKTAQLSAELGR